MVHNKIGRPRKFDRTDALSAAVEVFWEKGFDGASLDDLTSAMGINRPSLYSTFGNKEKLYLSALSAYSKDIGGAPLRAFLAETDPKCAVRAFFQTLVEFQTRTGDLAQGCLLASCAATSAKKIPDVADMLLAGTKIGSQTLEEAFERFKDANQLPALFPSKIRAELMLDIMYGFAYRSRVGEGRKALKAEIADKVAQVIGLV